MKINDFYKNNLMSSSELISRGLEPQTCIGNINEQIKTALKNCWENEIKYKLSELFSNYSCFNESDFLDFLYLEANETSHFSEIKNIVHFAFLKYILPLVQTGQLVPKENTLLSRYKNETFCEDVQTYEILIRRVLSILSRKEFDYFVEKYFCLNNVKYNKKYEKRFERIFKGYAAESYMLKKLNTKLLPPSETLYLHLMSFIPYEFIDQIGTKFDIVPSEEFTNEMKRELIHRNRTEWRLKSTFIIFVVFIVISLISFIYLYLGNP